MNGRAKPRIGFVLEQALGHVAYGMGLRKALASRDDIDPVWIDVPFEPGRFGKLPAIGGNWTLRGSVRARMGIARERPLDALFIHTQTISIFSSGHMAETPALLSLDATPINYDELAGAYRDKVHPKVVERVKLAIHRTVMRSATRFTTWSQWAKDSLVNDYGANPDKVSVIYPGTVVSNFAAAASRAPRKEGPLRILFVGGDFPRKGGDLLLDVFRTHLRGKAELHLVTGADVAPGGGIFVYRGLKPHSPELLERYREADVFVLPTRGDCLAMVLGEAMASALPIITTRVGAHAEAVEDGESGFVIDKDDARALRAKIELLIDDRDRCFQMGARSRRIGEQRFDMEKNAHRIADILIEIGAERRG
jgi:glycosyltransferase involved in cell wall biosynthesis